MKCYQLCPGFELVSPCPFPAMITISPQAPPNPCISSWPGAFQFATFLSVAFSGSRCISASGSSSVPWNSFLISFNLSAFLLCCFSSHDLNLTCFVSFVSVYAFFAIDIFVKFLFVILVMWGKSGYFSQDHDSNKPHLPVRYQARLILSKRYSLDLPLWLETQLQNPCF